MQNQVTMEYLLDWLSGDTSTYDEEVGSRDWHGVAFFWRETPELASVVPVHSHSLIVSDQDWAEARATLVHSTTTCAILEIDPSGMRYSTLFDDRDDAEAAWSELKEDLEEEDEDA